MALSAVYSIIHLKRDVYIVRSDILSFTHGTLTLLLNERKEKATVGYIIIPIYSAADMGYSY